MLQYDYIIQYLQIHIQKHIRRVPEDNNVSGIYHLLTNKKLYETYGFYLWLLLTSRCVVSWNFTGVSDEHPTYGHPEHEASRLLRNVLNFHQNAYAMSRKPNAYTVVSCTIDLLTFEAECGRFCGMYQAAEYIEACNRRLRSSGI